MREIIQKPASELLPGEQVKYGKRWYAIHKAARPIKHPIEGAGNWVEVWSQLLSGRRGYMGLTFREDELVEYRERPGY